MKKWYAVIVLAFAQFVMVLDSTVMNVSIMTVVKDLGTTVNSMQSAIAFYTLTMAALMLIGAKLAARWGLLKAFAVGAIIYGIGSTITAVSQNFAQLFIGWSVIEGVGAVLVIPAIAALVATNYQGKDRVTAYAIIGGISGAAAAAGPLIGGFMTTYLSWRYVFAFEVVIMIGVILASKPLKTLPANKSIKVDFWSAVLSSTGLVMLVFAFLQSKTWGWIEPLNIPEINGHQIAPFGISIVIYLILIAIGLLKMFYDRQLDMEADGREPLVKASMLSIKRLRSGLSVLMSQYLITAAIFFIIPVYLQTVLGYDALKTGLKILPLSVALILFSGLGSKLVNKYSPKKIVRLGQFMLVIGTLFMMESVDTQLKSTIFGIAMFIVGGGLGLLASQLGNVNVSAVPEKDANEVGGLQGTFQNIGSSLGTALIGSVMIATLTSNIISSVNSSSLPSQTKTYINQNLKSAEIIPASQVVPLAESKGASQQDAQELSDIYAESQLSSLQDALFFLAAISFLMIVFSRNIPDKKIS